MITLHTINGAPLQIDESKITDISPHPENKLTTVFTQNGEVKVVEAKDYIKQIIRFERGKVNV